MEGKYSTFGKVTLIKEPYAHLMAILNMDTAFIFMFGITFIIILFAIGLLVILREKLYFYYSGYALSIFFYLINISGFLVYLDLQKYIYVWHMAVSFAFAFLILFSTEILNIKKYLPKYYRYIQYLSIPYFILGIIFIFEYKPWNQVLNTTSFFITILLILLSIYTFIKGNKKSLYYTFALVLYMSFVLLFVLMNAGVFEYSTTGRYGFIVSIACENIIFSFLLISRYNDLKNKVQERLEKEVNQRTRDIQKINKKLESSLKERGLLLRELYHRVKNNFHIITAILWLEGNKNKENKAFERLINRIESMSLVHEYLYNSKNLDNIDIKDVFSKIVKNITIDPSKITIKENYSLDITIELQHALSLGMILNELVTNSIKHNPNKDNLEITIELYNQDNRVYLSIKDNGVGYEQNLTEGIGLNLVKDFCTNLPDAIYNFTTDKGAIFTLDYKEEIKEL